MISTYLFYHTYLKDTIRISNNLTVSAKKVYTNLGNCRLIRSIGNGSQAFDKAVLKKTLRGIITNPIILGIAAGLLWSAFKLPLSYIMERAVENVAGTATPLGLIAMGASFDIRKAFAKIRPSITAAFIKLVGFCALFLPAAVHMGFRREELVAILVMLGSATTVTSFVMAKNMGHDGVLSSGVVMLTTLCSAFTLTGWLYVLKSMGLV